MTCSPAPCMMVIILNAVLRHKATIDGHFVDSRLENQLPSVSQTSFTLTENAILFAFHVWGILK